MTAKPAAAAAHHGEHAARVLPSSPIARALALIGDRWTVLVMREMFLGKTRFGEFAEATGASRATLTKRLRSLLENGLATQHPYQTRPLRVEYRLTDKSFGLYDFALSIWAWEYHWSDRDGARLPARLQHRSCAHAFVPEPVCARCDSIIDIREMRFRPGKGAGAASVLNQGALRRSAAKLGDRDAAQGIMLHVIDIVADHWTPLVLAAAFMGIRRYDDIRRELGIATNILAHRLRLLVDAGVLQQARGAGGGKRLEYRLSDKGRALIVPALTLHQWSLQWLQAGDPPSMQIMHKCSGRALRLRMQCSHCHGTLAPQDVSF
jgi:DNA-binding HxlR family transcriptional regulator